MTRTKCPHCTYSAEGSLDGHLSMLSGKIGHPVYTAAEQPEKPKRPRKPVKVVIPDISDPSIPDDELAIKVAEPEEDTYTVGIRVDDLTREAWLLAAIEGMKPWFEAAGYEVPEVRISIGFPAGRSAKGSTIGQCWYTVADGVPALFVSPVLDKAFDIAETALHEVCHAVVGPTKQAHRGKFVKVAKAVGFIAPWTSTPSSDELRERLTKLVEQLGPFPHARVSKLTLPTKQGTRMLKVECPDCGCVVRMTRKWLDEVGAPTCGCGGEMEAA